MAIFDDVDMNRFVIVRVKLEDIPNMINIVGIMYYAV